MRILYALQGFSKVSEDTEENTVWEYIIPENYINKQSVITVNAESDIK